MEQKREIARQLLAQGLTIKQIRLQLRCSETFLRQVRAEARQEGQEER
jgi:transposase-like protein